MNRLLLLAFVFGCVPCLTFAHIDSLWCKDFKDKFCVITLFKTNCKHKCNTTSPEDPLHGHWGEWSQWGRCDVKCNKGRQTRTRLCNNPSSRNGGHDCDGSNTETKECEGTECPVNGQWGAWTSECSATCGDSASRIKTAKCNNPSPQNDGAVCPGGLPADPYTKYEVEEKSESCGAKTKCPVDGELTEWGNWGTCSEPCGEFGKQTRTRQCINLDRGKDCHQHLSEERRCNHIVCPIDGGYTEYSGWSDCVTVDSRGCGRGYRYKSRCCTNPTPKYNGKDCSDLGSPIKIEVCYMKHCPLDGQWTPWSPYEPCDPTCGKGTKTRRRKCEFPAPRWDGINCDGKGQSEESQVCNEGEEHACPVDGQWTAWTTADNSDCTSYCKKFSHRCCTGIVGAGKACVGDSFKEYNCLPGSGDCIKL